jgi:hypothetical protein
VLFYTAREAEAEELLRAGLVKPLGRGSKIRCLQLACLRKAAWSFLRGGRSFGQASKTFKIERVGDKRLPLYQHVAERCLQFRPEVKVTTAPELPETSEFSDLKKANKPEPQALQIIPDERGIAEKEPERVPVEPETPADSACQAGAAYHGFPCPISEPEQHDTSAERDLARAVLLKAFQDAETDAMTWRWFEASQGTLEFWRSVGVGSGRVRKRARESGEPKTRR